MHYGNHWNFRPWKKSDYTPKINYEKGAEHIAYSNDPFFVLPKVAVKSPGAQLAGWWWGVDLRTRSSRFDSQPGHMSR